MGVSDLKRADVEELRQLAKDFRKYAKEIRDCAQESDRQLKKVTAVWEGRSEEKFLAKFNSLLPKWRDTTPKDLEEIANFLERVACRFEAADSG